MVYGAIGLVLLVVWIYCIFDVISTDESLARNLPKIVWLLIVILLPTIGSITWLLLGRPQRTSSLSGGSAYRAAARPPRRARSLPPDDDPRFLSSLDDRARKLRDWEAELERREDELRKRDGDEPPGVA